MVPAANNKNDGKYNVRDQEELIGEAPHVESAAERENNGTESSDDAPDPVRRGNCLMAHPSALYNTTADRVKKDQEIEDACHPAMQYKEG